MTATIRDTILLRIIIQYNKGIGRRGRVAAAHEQSGSQEIFRPDYFYSFFFLFRSIRLLWDCNLEKLLRQETTMFASAKCIIPKSYIYCNTI